MKLFKLLLALTLCAALAVPAAVAQDVYVPGEVTQQILSDAFSSGKIVGGTMTFTIDLDPSLIAESEEEAQLAAAALDLISGVTFTGGAGMTPDGLRVELAVDYAGDAGSVGLTGAANMTMDGVSVESNIIEGEVITARWETVLALTGMPQENIDVIMSLKDMDWNALISEAVAMAPELAQQGAQMLAPYGQIAVEWVASLPTAQKENIPASDEYHPETALLMQVSFLPKDVARLLVAVADQLENDAAMTPIIDAILAESGLEEEGISCTADLCRAMRSLAASADGTVPIVINIGFNEDGVPMYVEVFDATEDDSGFHVALHFYETDTPNLFAYLFSVAVYDAGAVVSDAFGVHGQVQTYPENENLVDMTLNMSIIAGGQRIGSADMTFISKDAPSDAGLPGYDMAMNMNMSIDEDGETGSAVSSSNYRYEMTAEGGEKMTYSMKQEIYADGARVATTSTETVTVNPGFTGSYSMNQVMEDGSMKMGFGVNGILFANEYDAAAHAALKPMALETMTNDDMNALVDRVSSNGQTLLIRLIQVLPPEILQMIMNQ